jgi:hypothetical protein
MIAYMNYKIRILIYLLVATTPAWGADSIRIPATKDNSIVMVDGEWNENAGQQGRMRIKGNQHIIAMDFDLALIQGKRFTKATLVCQQGEQSIQGVSLSTIATPWDENRSTGLTCGIQTITDWGYPGARFPAVMGGNSFTLVEQSESILSNGEYRWEVPTEMVHAMAIGIAHGLAIHEHDANYKRNPTIFSCEQSSKKPYLLVEFDDAGDALPEPATDLKLIIDENEVSHLVLKAPAQGFAYEVTIDGEPLSRHNIPLVEQNASQKISLRDLPESIQRGRVNEIAVVTLNRTGQRSNRVLRKVVLGVPSMITPPERGPIAEPAVGVANVANVGVIPLGDKYDSSGNSVGELPSDYRVHNAIFDGQQVRLVAAAGEVVGFQLLLRGQGDVRVQVSLDEIKPRIDLLHAVHVPAQGRLIPDPLLPLPERLSLHQDTDEIVVADIYIPFDAASGNLRGQIEISDGRVIPLMVEVLPLSLPKQATFFCEMNSYGLPENVTDYYALQQIAYDHRVHANILHYSHNTASEGSRKSNLDMRLKSGKRMDNKRYDLIEPESKEAYWSDFVEAFGPYIDGSLFRDGHRGPIPAPGFYLTFHESWPLHCRPYFNGNLDAYQAFSDKPAYARTYVNILQDFAALAKSKGWTQTGFQVYFNNKGSLDQLTKAPWILDEPSSYWDYRALQYYGELTDAGRATTREVNIQYRVDISRPEYCRGQLSQRKDLWVVASSAFQRYRRLVSDRIQRDGMQAWIYGSANHVHDSNRNVYAWVLDAWRDGATGIVPWQTINKNGNAMKEADQLGLFIFDRSASGDIEIRHSLRLKAFRESQQLIEYLNLMKARTGWSQDQMRRFINQHVDLFANVDKTNDDDAGTNAYHKATAVSIENLKRRIVNSLRQPR